MAKKIKQKISLPLSLDNKWLINEENNINEYNELSEAFSDIIKLNFSYNYEITYKYYDAEDDTLKSEIIQGHCHTFNELVKVLYDYPESFKIPKNFLEDYSLKEINYLKRLQNYLLLINLKDKTDSKENINLQKKYKNNSNNKKFIHELNKLNEEEEIKRVCNKKALNYNNAGYFVASDDILKAILNGDKKTRIFRQYSFSKSRINKKYFILDENNNYKALISIIKEEIVPFKEFKVPSKEYKINGFKNIDDYKKELFKFFESDMIEEFTEESLVCIATFKILETF